MSAVYKLTSMIVEGALCLAGSMAGQTAHQQEGAAHVLRGASLRTALKLYTTLFTCGGVLAAITALASLAIALLTSSGACSAKHQQVSHQLQHIGFTS